MKNGQSPRTIIEHIIRSQEIVATDLENAKKALENTLNALNILNAELIDVERGYKRTEELFLKHYRAALKKEIYLREFSARNMRRVIKTLGEELACLNLSVEECSKLPGDLVTRINQTVTFIPTDDLIVH